MKMNKNEYLRSMARHATLLCCIVPFIAAVSAKAEESYSWSGSNNDPDHLEIQLTQSVSIEEWGAPISIAQFNKNTFSTDFGSELRGIDASLPNYSNWALSEVIIELSGTVNGTVVYSSSTKMQLTGDVANGATPTISLGDYTLTSGNGTATLPVTVSATGSTLINPDGAWGRQKIVDGETTTYTWTHTIPTTVNQSTEIANTALFSGSDSVTATFEDDVAVSGIQYYTVTGSLDDDEFTYIPNSNPPGYAGTLSGVNLTMNIRYIVTPEPGTMALLLTGIPLFLVRRRKSWKK